MPTAQEFVHPDFGALNYAMVVLYLVGMLLVGWWCSRRITGTRAFFIAEGKMNWFVVGLSILGTYLSALTMMALPAVSFGKDSWTWTVQLPFLIVTAIVITRYVLPRYREANVISVYEFLEKRLHVSCRLAASACFILFSIGRNGLVLYLPALAFSTVTGFPLAWTIIVMGIVITLYTVLGGMEAVVWTDAIQVIIFVCAAVMSLGFILAQTGDQFLAVAHQHGKFQVFAWSLDFTRITTIWLVLETIVQTIRIYASQQDIAQRFMATPNPAAANRSVWLGILGYIPLGYLFYFMGTALFVFYQLHPDTNFQALLAMGKGKDAIYPYFIVSHLPAGLAGLVIAAIFAAAMSSIDSLMNSSSTVCVEDFYRRFARREKPDAHYLAVARGLTVLWGVLATGTALSFMGIDKAQYVWSQVMSFTTNGVVALVALALLPRRVDWRAAMVGFVLGFALLFEMKFRTNLHFLLYPVLGNLFCFALSYVLDEVIRVYSPRCAEAQGS